MLQSDRAFGATFPAASRADWSRVAKLADDTLETRAAGVIRRALEDEGSTPTGANPAGWPGSAPFTRGRTPAARVVGGWDSRQIVSGQTPASANAEALEELNGGARSVEIRLDRAFRALDWSQGRGERGLAVVDAAGLADALDGIDLSIAAVAIRPGGGGALAAALALAALRRNGARGWRDGRCGLNFDPFAAIARLGLAPYDQAGLQAEVSSIVAHFAANGGQSNALAASDIAYHDAGADDALSAAAALSAGVSYLRAAEAGGTPLDMAAKQILFPLAIGADVMFGIAKLRAFRMVWGRAALLAGVSSGAAGAWIQAVAAPRMYARLDPFTNMIRAACAGFAAALGGADVITLPSYESACGRPTAFGRRVARNLHHLLMEESQLHRVIDPMGGSWTIEALTQKLAAEIWARFQAIEAEGGIGAALESGALQAMVAASAEDTLADVGTRKAPIIGVSLYPDLDAASAELSLDEREAAAADAAARIAAAAPAEGVAGKRGVERIMAAAAAFEAGAAAPTVAAALYPDDQPRLACAPLKRMRLAAPFEALRDRAAAAKKPPVILIARLGDDRMSRARADFVRGAYAAGGLRAEEATGDWAAALTASGARVAVLAGSDEVYDAQGQDAVLALQDAGAQAVHIAGGGGRGVAMGCSAIVAQGADLLGPLDAALTGSLNP